MKKSILKIISSLICFIFIFSLSFVFADETMAGDEQVIKSITNSILSVLMWFAYAIALGIVLLLGIKYMMSPANEKANLKGLFPKYIIGIIAILFCVTIAKTVASIAGNDKAEDIIGVGEDFGINYVEGSKEEASSNNSNTNNTNANVNTNSNTGKCSASSTGNHTWPTAGKSNGNGKVEYFCKDCGALLMRTDEFVNPSITN